MTDSATVQRPITRRADALSVAMSGILALFVIKFSKAGLRWLDGAALDRVAADRREVATRRSALNQMSAADRDVTRGLLDKIARSNSNPFLVLARFAGNSELDPALRIMAARYLLPYFASPAPLEASINHSHLHAHADLTREDLLRELNARLDRMASTRAPILDAEPTLPEPEGDAAE